MACVHEQAANPAPGRGLGENMSKKEKQDRPTEARDMRRRALARDAIVFQGKLLLDAAKDLILGPAGLFSALLDLISPRPRKDMRFYKVLRVGKRAERTINLFEAATGPGPEGQWTVDDVIRDVESQLRDRYRSEPVSTTAKQATDKKLQADKESDEDRS
jgi:hypothetical protein